MRMVSTIEAANGYWDAILAHFIGTDFLKYTRKEGPCPNCEGETRFRYDNKDGSGSFYCRHCGAGYGIDLIQRVMSWDFKTAAFEIDKYLKVNQAVKDGYVNKEVDHTEMLNKISSVLLPVTNKDIVDFYLKERGIKEYDQRYFRRLPRYPYYNEDGKIIGHADCMCCRIVNSAGKRIGYHLTYLLDGVKAQYVNSAMNPSRKVRGKQSDGVIPLASYHEKCKDKKYKILAVAEGIETALAYTQHNGHICWSTINAGNLLKFEPPMDVNILVIVADNDESFTGLDVASSLARRLQNEVKQGKKPNLRMIKIVIPVDKGKDYLDVINNGVPRAQTACF